jgi:hypothetical protein
MRELARSGKRGRQYRVYLVGGGTAVLKGWRETTIDADLYAEHDDIFRNIQDIKERLQINVEFARPEDFVPPLAGAGQRHVFIERVSGVDFYHYDPCSQMLSKIVRGFDRDLNDAKAFLAAGMVDPEVFGKLVRAIPDTEYAKYPALTPGAVRDAVDAFLDAAKMLAPGH